MAVAKGVPGGGKSRCEGRKVESSRAWDLGRHEGKREGWERSLFYPPCDRKPVGGRNKGLADVM